VIDNSASQHIEAARIVGGVAPFPRGMRPGNIAAITVTSSAVGFAIDDILPPIMACPAPGIHMRLTPSSARFAGRFRQEPECCRRRPEALLQDKPQQQTLDFVGLTPKGGCVQRLERSNSQDKAGAPAWLVGRAGLPSVWRCDRILLGGRGRGSFVLFF